MRAKIVTTLAEDEPASLHELIQLAPVDVLGQAVGHVALTLHFDNGQLSSVMQAHAPKVLILENHYFVNQFKAI